MLLTGKRGDTIKCAIYCRLSKEDTLSVPGTVKSSESESIQNQKSLLLNYANEMGWEVYRIYADEDYSGADRDRPDFLRLIADAKARLFDIVLCKTQSRFTRDMELVERYIHGLFPQLGIRFIALVDHADTEVSGNKKARQINGLVNEWYLEDLSENIRAVLDNKRKSGKFIGSFPVYGYRKDPDDRNRLLIDDEAARVVRLIFSLAASGYGKQRIADHLNKAGIPNPTRYKELNGYSYVNAMAHRGTQLWNRTTVGRILKNETYVGTLVQGKRRKVSYKSSKVAEVPREGWIRVEGTHEGIIDRQLFDAVQSLLKERTRAGENGGNPHLLAGKVRCDTCGRVMKKSSVCYKGVSRSYLRCELCPGHSVRLDHLENLINTKLKWHYESLFGEAWEKSEAFTQQPERINGTHSSILDAAEKRIMYYIRAIEALYLDKASGRIDEPTFEKLYSSIRRKKDEQEEKLSYMRGRYAHAGPGGEEEQHAKDRGFNEVTYFISSVAVSKKDPLTNEQRILVNWMF